VLFDLGHVSTPEPFQKLVNQGLILGEIEHYRFQVSDEESIEEAYAFRPNENWFQGPWISADEIVDIKEAGQLLIGKHKQTGKVMIAAKINDPERVIEKRGGDFFLKGTNIKAEVRTTKMSKSRGNVVNPDDVIREYGADALRCYEMFMGPLEQVKPWSMTGVEGVFRFLARVWRLVMEENQTGEWILSSAVQDVPMDKALAKVVHATIKKVGEDIEELSFNTAISQMMICTNALTAANPRPVAALRLLLQVLNPFAPHLTEELWERLGSAGTVTDQPWPAFDPALLIEDEIEMPIQVNGKVRDKVVVKKDAAREEIEALARSSARVAEWTAGKEIKKVVVVPGKLVNIVVV
jgi:leucyl-tRNA synthetase